MFNVIYNKAAMCWGKNMEGKGDGWLLRVITSH